MDAKAKKFLEAVLAELRTDIAHHRAEGASEERIRQILGEGKVLQTWEVAWFPTRRIRR